MSPTAKDFDSIIEEFYSEMDVANQGRMTELQEVINILLEEKERRGL